jgi:hypothetical protein
LRSPAPPSWPPARSGSAALVILAAAAGALSACAAAEYRPPTLSEPHAQVKVRLLYRAWSGDELEQRLTIDGSDVRDLPAPAPRPGAETTRTLVVRPGASTWSIQAAFFHNNVTTSAETYDTVEKAPCGASDCPQIKPRTRLVNHVERVDDAGCAKGLKLATKAGEKYVLEFTYTADRQCTFECSREGHGPHAKEPCASPGGAGK